MTVKELLMLRDSVAGEILGYVERGDYENSYHLQEKYDRLNKAVLEVEKMGAMKQLSVIAEQEPELTWEELVSEYEMNR
jgi:hypothetical protein